MSNQLPSGTVTFLFTDIEGSTSLWEKMPADMQVSVAIHQSILRQAIESNGGSVWQIVGDAFQAVFKLPILGLCAAISAQLGLMQAEWGATGPIRVRMGIHTGSAELDEKGEVPYAPSHTLNRSSRIMSAGHGGQILLSQEAAELTRRDLPNGVTLKDLGEHRLKGLSIPEHIYQVLAPNLPAAFPLLNSLDNLPNNLPKQLTSFIGREKELAELHRLLTTTPARLVTLSGAGGTGKTRLSLQAAVESLDYFADGIYFIPLAQLTDPSLVPSAIAAALNVHEYHGQSLTQSLKDHLYSKHILLVLDNFEQVSGAKSLISELLSSAPNLKILITSRVILRIYGEYDYQVPPLGLPNPLHLPDHEQLAQYEAVQLFIQRAQAAKSSFVITRINAPAIVEICYRLDGLPLAIELAAARVRILPPEALLSRLVNRLQLLTGGAENLPIRQQTLRNTISWSYDMLDQKEKRVFACLSVFNSGCTLEAAEIVCQDEADPSFNPIDELEELVDKSLLKQEEINGDSRFVMLDTIHEFAQEKLLNSGESEIIKMRHANFYFELARATRTLLEHSEQAVWFERLERENGNLNTALRWVKESGRIKMDSQLFDVLCLFWFVRGHLTEGRKLQEELLSLPSVLEDPLLHANLLNRAGFLARYQGDYEGAQALIHESLTICQKLDNQPMMADVMANLGFVTLQQTHYTQARALYRKALTIYRKLDNRQGIADSFSHLALIAFYEDDFKTARYYDEESLKIWQSLEDKQGIAWACSRLGNVVFHQGDFEKAYGLFMEGLQVSNELSFKWGIAVALEGFACIAVVRGQAEYGLQLAGAASALRKVTSVPLSIAGQAKLDSALFPAKQILGIEASSQAWAMGQTMDVAEIVHSILEEKEAKSSNIPIYPERKSILSSYDKYH